MVTKFRQRANSLINLKDKWLKFCSVSKINLCCTGSTFCLPCAPCIHLKCVAETDCFLIQAVFHISFLNFTFFQFHLYSDSDHRNSHKADLQKSGWRFKSILKKPEAAVVRRNSSRRKLSEEPDSKRGLFWVTVDNGILVIILYSFIKKLHLFFFFNNFNNSIKMLLFLKC